MESPVVTIKQGQLVGKVSHDRYDHQFYSFQGIPYAKPPIGALRFKAPQPPEPWVGIRKATKEGNECFSHDMLTKSLVGSEDCLVLNVYTPAVYKARTERLKPVMVWIHGGAFISGSSKTTMFGPEFLITEDIVLVTINYRFGILGFLSLDDPELHVPGNAGLKDMVMALRWVKENIENFCGDPNNVTIFGESSGAASVHLLYISPMAKGLFHRAIAQSGCALNNWIIKKGCSKELAKIIGVDHENQKEMLRHLQSLSVQGILRAQDALDDRVWYCSDIALIGPVIEKNMDEPAFLTEHPWELLSSGNYNKVPLMIGFMSRDGMFFDLMYADHPTRYERFPKDFERMIPHELGVTRGSELSKRIAQKIKQFYANDEDFDETNIDKYYVMRTDIFFLRGIYMTLRHQLATSDTPIYLYRASVETSLNAFKNFWRLKSPGACHGDDLGYLFKNMSTPYIRSGSLEDKSITRFVKFWTSFAKNGNPNPKVKDPCIDVTWKPCEKNKFHFIDIGKTLTVGVNPEFERMQFWDKICGLNSTIKKRF